jgi:methylglutaconyl-CoA hydratase
MELTKRMIGELQALPINAALDQAAEWNAKARETDDCRDGISAFLAKKPLNW